MSTILSILITLAIIYAVLRFILAKPLIKHFKAKANAGLNIASYNEASDYSKIGYCPIHNELSQAEVTIEGELPSDLNGIYLRNGTNSPFDRNESRRHMFNGAGMIHQVHINSGKVTYSNHYTDTPRYLAEKAAGKELYPCGP